MQAAGAATPWTTASLGRVVVKEELLVQSPGLREEIWPVLPLESWSDTYATLHMWTQIVGKIRLAQSPWVNHSWHTTLYVTSSGLTTSPIPHGARTFQIDFDFLSHELVVQASDGRTNTLPLEAAYLRLAVLAIIIVLPMPIMIVITVAVHSLVCNTDSERRLQSKAQHGLTRNTNGP